MNPATNAKVADLKKELAFKTKAKEILLPKSELEALIIRIEADAKRIEKLENASRHWHLQFTVLEKQAETDAKVIEAARHHCSVFTIASLKALDAALAERGE